MSEEAVFALLRVRFNVIDECFEALEHRLAELRAGIQRDFAAVNERLDKIEKRLVRVERRV